MGTGPEGQPRIQHDVDGAWVRHITPARTDPQPFAKLHRVEVIHPFADPVLVFELLNLVGHLLAEVALEEGDDRGRIDFRIKQPGHHGLAPQLGLTRQRFVDGVVMGVHVGDGLGSLAHQHITEFIGGFSGGVEPDLYPRHGESLSR